MDRKDKEKENEGFEEEKSFEELFEGIGLDMEEGERETEEESKSLFLLESTCSKCGNDFLEGYTAYIGNERTRELRAVVQLCSDCWKNFEKVLKKLGLWSVEMEDETKCFGCGSSDAYLSFQIVREGPDPEEEMTITITETYCFLIFCKSCAVKFLFDMKTHFISFTLDEIYEKAIEFCESE